MVTEFGSLCSCRAQSNEEFEDTKGEIRIQNQRGTNNTMVKRKHTKGQTTIYKALHRNLEIQHHELHSNRE